MLLGHGREWGIAVCRGMNGPKVYLLDGIGQKKRGQCSVILPLCVCVCVCVV